ncbi:MAG: hypothetical protein ACKVWV_05865 [Planctomycetota bacterium]
MHTRILFRGLALSVAALGFDAARAQCPSWDPGFGSIGADNLVYDMLAFDDGSGAGTSLFLGGLLLTAGGTVVSHVARWNGTTWSSLGTGIGGPISSRGVSAFAQFDDGAGDALFVSGTFESADGVSCRNIARWDGSAWSPLGSGITGGVGTGVVALVVFDDGSGPALYAGGTFNTAGGTAAANVARWDGSNWSALGSGTNGAVYTLAVFDGGSGPALYAGGRFTVAGGVTTGYVARWNGTSWSAVGPFGSETGCCSRVMTLAALDDGSGPALYAGGRFAHAGSVNANSLAKWNGSAWSEVGGGFAGTIDSPTSSDHRVSSLRMFDDGSGPALFVGGNFRRVGALTVNGVAKWNGSSWSGVGAGLYPASSPTAVECFEVFDDGLGGGPKLFVGGYFHGVSGVPARYIANWNGKRWKYLPGSATGLDGAVRALEEFEDRCDPGPSLYAAGQFQTAGSLPVKSIARWNGSQWSSLGTGLEQSGTEAVGYALCEYDDELGAGPMLYAGGTFEFAGGVPANNIARWNGSAWSSLGSGIPGGLVHALAVHRDVAGGQPALFAAGQFFTAGGVPARNIARWSGTAWSSLGGGLAGSGADTVRALAVFDDGSGPMLYAGGSFAQSGGITAIGLARWTGTQWQEVGGGVTPYVAALAVFDDGSGGGPALYVGGNFESVGGIPAHNVARWDGQAWSALGSGLAGSSGGSAVRSLSVFDDGSGSGPALYAGGEIGYVTLGNPNGVAKWDGTAWSPLGSGTTGTHSTPAVWALVPFTFGDTTSLFVGGDFTIAGGNSSRGIAAWRGCAGPGTPGTGFCFGDGSLTTPCPCAPPDFVPNPSGDPDAGCANSFHLGGGRLVASGSAQQDTVVLSADHISPSAFCFFFSGTSEVPAGIAIGDGVRCVGGALVRFGSQYSVCGTALYPNEAIGSTRPLSYVSGTFAGSAATRSYQCYYRNAAAMFCSSATTNLTNAVRITWN